MKAFFIKSPNSMNTRESDEELAANLLKTKIKINCDLRWFKKFFFTAFVELIVKFWDAETL